MYQSYTKMGSVAIWKKYKTKYLELKTQLDK